MHYVLCAVFYATLEVNVCCLFRVHFAMCHMLYVVHYMICTAQNVRFMCLNCISEKELEYFIREWEHEYEKVATDS